MPDMEACTPCGTCDVSSSNVDSMSEDQSTIPWRCPPAQTPRVSTMGGKPGAALSKGVVNKESQSLTHKFEAKAAGPYEVS